jgi:hypothetical protein
VEPKRRRSWTSKYPILSGENDSFVGGRKTAGEGTLRFSIELTLQVDNRQLFTVVRTRLGVAGGGGGGGACAHTQSPNL